MRISLLLLVLGLAPLFAVARPSIEEIDPASTGAGIIKAMSPHHVVTDGASPSNGHLVITIGGTGSTTKEFDYVAELAASMGYRVLSVDYPNKVISTVCQTNSDPLCYDKYRAEIVYGQPVSPIVDVDFTNSISHRIDSLFTMLVSRDRQAWGDLALPDGSIDWSKVVLIGHSQGAGHVGYLSKGHAVARVVMIGGPHDKAHGALAGWVLKPGATATDRYFGFLHEKDYFDSKLEAEVIRGLMANPRAPALPIEAEIPKGAGQHIFITDLPARDPHNSMAKPVFEKVWRTLLQ